MTDSMDDLVYYYNPTPAREPSPAELWWESLKEGDEIPMYDSNGERIGTAILGPRADPEAIPFQISANACDHDGCTETAFSGGGCLLHVGLDDETAQACRFWLNRWVTEDPS